MQRVVGVEGITCVGEPADGLVAQQLGGPERPERHGHQRGGGRIVAEPVAEREPKVGELVPEADEPRPLVVAVELGPCTADQFGVVLGVAAMHVGSVIASGQTTDCVLTNGLKEPVARRAFDIGDLDHRLRLEAGDQIERIELVERRDGRDGFEVEPALERAEHGEHVLLRSVKEAMAPVERGFERAMPIVTGRAAQQAHPLVQPIRQLGHGQHRRAGRSQLDGQWQAVDLHADPPDRRVVHGRAHHGATRRLGAVEEQRERVV